MPQRSTARYDPVLRELLAARMVEKRQGPDGRRTWQLTEGAQQRLEAMERVAADPAKVELYFGYLCVVCHEDRVTRRQGDQYVCDDCAQDDERGVALG